MKNSYIVISNPKVISLMYYLLESVVYFFVQGAISSTFFAINLFLVPTLGIKIERVSNVFIFFLISILSTFLGKQYYKRRLKYVQKNIQTEIENYPEFANGVKNHIVTSFGASLTIIFSIALALLKSFFPASFQWV